MFLNRVFIGGCCVYRDMNVILNIRANRQRLGDVFRCLLMGELAAKAP